MKPTCAKGEPEHSRSCLVPPKRLKLLPSANATDLTARRGSKTRLSRLITPLSWWSLGAFVVVDLVWLPFSSLQFANSNLWIIGQSWLVIGLAFCMLRLAL